MNKPKKLIRPGVVDKLKPGEWETVTDPKELNSLYALKVREELAEIQASEHCDVLEFIDLMQVAYCWAKQIGFSEQTIWNAWVQKTDEKGLFKNIALNNLNPENPSNKLYFEQIPISEKDNLISNLYRCIEEQKGSIEMLHRQLGKHE